MHGEGMRGEGSRGVVTSLTAETVEDDGGAALTGRSEDARDTGTEEKRIKCLWDFGKGIQ